MSQLNEIFTKCEEYINILRNGEPGCFLLRAINTHEIDIKICHSAIKNRKPTGMPPKIHAKLNEHFEPIFTWPVRNGVFTYGVRDNLKDIKTVYGTTYLFFPIGKFKYVYDPEIFDLYASYTEFVTGSDSDIDSFINSISYSDKNINRAMSNIIREKKSAEIIINCEKYYLVSLKYVDELKRLIWAKSF